MCDLPPLHDVHLLLPMRLEHSCCPFDGMVQPHVGQGDARVSPMVDVIHHDSEGTSRHEILSHSVRSGHGITLEARFGIWYKMSMGICDCRF